MGINFEHKDIIYSIKNEFPKFITSSLRKNRILREDVKINPEKSPYRVGSGDSEKLYDVNKVTICKKSFLLTFMEDADGNLIIFFNKSRVYTVKPKERISSKLLVSLVNSVRKILAE